LWVEISLNWSLIVSFEAVSFVQPLVSTIPPTTTPAMKASEAAQQEDPQTKQVKEAFQDFVGQTFFAEMIKAMRTTQEPAKYFNGGRAEKIFQGQLDQTLAEELSESSADKIADPMFKLFQLARQ
jgi:peptidoglycan hydrolase FlgJ